MPKQIAKRRSRAAKRVAPYRTLRGWAIGTLLETQAIIERPEHGHVRDRGSWAHGWDEAKAVAKAHPFPGATSRACVNAIGEVMASIGNECPECV